MHRLLETIAVFSFVDHVGVGPDHFNAMPLEDSIGGQIHGQIQCRLTTECWQQCVRLFCGDDLFDNPPIQRFDVGPLGGGRVSHDRRRVRIDQHNLVALFAESFTSLST